MRRGRGLYRAGWATEAAPGYATCHPLLGGREQCCTLSLLSCAAAVAKECAAAASVMPPAPREVGSAAPRPRFRRTDLSAPTPHGRQLPAAELMVGKELNKSSAFRREQGSLGDGGASAVPGYRHLAPRPTWLFISSTACSARSLLAKRTMPKPLQGRQAGVGGRMVRVRKV